MATRRKVASGTVQVAPAQVDLLDGLNPEQAAVVEHDKGALLVGAVAGAGKTKALVHRVAFLVRNRNVDPARILAVTFSVKAAREMLDRLDRLVPNSGARIGTFHSLGRQILAETRGLDGWTIDDSDRYRYVMKDVLGFRGMDWKTADITVVLQYVTQCKASCALPNTPEARAIAKRMATKAGNPGIERMLCEAYHRAEVERVNRRLLTFDDMLLGAWDLLRSDEAERARWAAKWDYVLTDEVQDNNLVQIRLAEMLARDHRNFMVVGDPGQSIYKFRGAAPEQLLAFEGEWAAAVIKMHRNYRCGEAIIQAANGVLNAMAPSTHLGMTMTAERGVAGAVKGLLFESADDEGEGIIAHFRELHASGVAWRDMVVLYRTNAQSRGVEEACLANRIPYVVIGGTNFYDRREVKVLLAYVRLAAGRGSYEDVKLAINSPFRFLGKAYLDRVQSNGRGRSDWTNVVRETADEGGIQGRQRTSAYEWAALIDTMALKIETARRMGLLGAKGMAARPARLLEDVLMSTDYVRWLTRDEGSESVENNRVTNVRELVRAAERFPMVDELLDYIDETLAAAKKAKDDDGKADRVTLTSLHRSKGLEWPVVAVIGCNEKILPHARAEDMDEERRLFYVGTTRARDTLIYSACRMATVGSRVIALEPSRFLAEAGCTTLTTRDGIKAVVDIDDNDEGDSNAAE